MKANIHPTWYSNAVVTCACGNSFTTGSTVPQIKVELCSKCHPFFTGQQKLVDTLGQVDRFQKRVAESTVKMEKRKEIVEQRSKKIKAVSEERPSLKDLLMRARKQAATS